MKSKQFEIGQLVRYKPGSGTYGYEDVLEEDGRLPCVVAGFSRTRVRVQFLKGRLLHTARSVDAASLQSAAETR